MNSIEREKIMHRTGAMASVCFCAGLLGALGAGFAFQLLGSMGLDRLAEGGLTTQWLPPGLCPRLLHGGLWGLAFLDRKSTRLNSSHYS